MELFYKHVCGRTILNHHTQASCKDPRVPLPNSLGPKSPKIILFQNDDNQQK